MCTFIDENDVLGLLQFIHDSFDTLLELTAILGSATIRAKSRVTTFLSRRFSGTKPEAICWQVPPQLQFSQRLPHQSERGCFCSAAKNLRNTVFSPTTTGSISPFLAICVKSAKGFEGRGFHVFASLLVPRLPATEASFPQRREVWIQLRKNFVATAIRVRPADFRTGRHLPFAKEAKKDMFRPQ